MEFEEYLMETHARLFRDSPADSRSDFEQWLSSLNSRDYIKYANEALHRAEVRRNERILEIFSRKEYRYNDHQDRS
jgi:hypothetical protein